MGGNQSKKPDPKQAQLKAKQDAVTALENQEQNSASLSKSAGNYNIDKNNEQQQILDDKIDKQSDISSQSKQNNKKGNSSYTDEELLTRSEKTLRSAGTTQARSTRDGTSNDSKEIRKSSLSGKSDSTSKSNIKERQIDDGDASCMFSVTSSNEKNKKLIID